jgi:hypothetical protein
MAAQEQQQLLVGDSACASRQQQQWQLTGREFSSSTGMIDKLQQQQWLYSWMRRQL